MQVITGTESIPEVQCPEIRQLIQIRILQNNLNHGEGYLISSFVVVGAGDSVHDVEQAVCAQLRQIKTNQPIDEEFIYRVD